MGASIRARVRTCVCAYAHAAPRFVVRSFDDEMKLEVFDKVETKICTQFASALMCSFGSILSLSGLSSNQDTAPAG